MFKASSGCGRGSSWRPPAPAQGVRLVCPNDAVGPQAAAYDRAIAENAYDDQVNNAATLRTEAAMRDGEAY